MGCHCISYLSSGISNIDNVRSKHNQLSVSITHYNLQRDPTGHCMCITSINNYISLPHTHIFCHIAFQSILKTDLVNTKHYKHYYYISVSKSLLATLHLSSDDLAS